MTPLDVEEKRKILRRIISSGLPLGVKPTESGLQLIVAGISQVYIRSMTVRGVGQYTFMVNAHPTNNLQPSYQLEDDDLDIETFAIEAPNHEAC